MGTCYNCFHEKNNPGPCAHCGYDSAAQQGKYPMALPEGSILAGRYVLGRALGQGGFGITYVAQDVQTEQRVAIKEFFPETMATRTAGHNVTAFTGQREDNFSYGMQCFLTEAQTLAQFLGTDSVVQVYSYFEENGTAYFAMEYVEGTSFQAYLRQRGGKLSWGEVKSVLFPVMDALALVHSKGIIHRDVSPDNIYLTADGKVKLLDFGSARYSLGDRSRSLDVVLKHGYAPKEQYTRRGRQGPYTDVYALAATYYYALTGRLPQESIDRIDDDELILPSSLGSDIPEAAEEALEKALAVQPGDRFQSMREFRTAMDARGGATEEPPVIIPPRKTEPIHFVEQKTAAKSESIPQEKPLNKFGPQPEEPVREKTVQEPVVQKTTQDTGTPPAPPVTPVKPGMKIGPVQIAAGAAVLVALLGVAFFAGRSGSPKASEPGTVVMETQRPREDSPVQTVGEDAQLQIDFDSITDTKTSAPEGNFHTVSACRNTVAIREDGSVLVTGNNEYGQSNLKGWDDLIYVSSGWEHTSGVRADGTAVAAGKDTYGACAVGDWKDLVAISSQGWNFTVGLKSDGTVVATGVNFDGRCDVGSWRDIVAISTGYSHTVGLKSDGTVLALGDNEAGQCEVGSWRDIVAIAAGADHTVGLKSDGTVVAVGDNNWGQCDVSGWSNIVSISTLQNHTVGLRKNGTVVAVGQNIYDQCDLSSWSDIVYISAGLNHTVGLKSDGTLVAAGDNKFGQCDVDGKNWSKVRLPNLPTDTEPATRATEPAKKVEAPKNGERKYTTISGGHEHTVAIREDGTVVAVGLNENGQCNVGSWRDIVEVSAGYDHTIGLKSDGTVVAAGDLNSKACNVSSWRDIVAISATGHNLTVGLKKDGTVVATGFSFAGQTNVESWRDIVAIATGYTHTVGLKKDGTVVAVGSNEEGECNVSSWKNIQDVAAGHDYTVGLKKDGTVVAVGSNTYGKCDVSGWKNIVAVAVYYDTTFGLMSDGTVLYAGNDSFKKTKIDGWDSKDIVAISTGCWHTLGLQADGTVIAAGKSDNGQCDVTTWRNIRLP